MKYRIPLSLASLAAGALTWAQEVPKQTPEKPVDNTPILTQTFWLQLGMWVILALMLAYGIAFLFFRSGMESKGAVRATKTGLAVGILIGILMIPVGLYATNTEFQKLLTANQKDKDKEKDKDKNGTNSGEPTTGGDDKTTTGGNPDDYITTSGGYGTDSGATTGGDTSAGSTTAGATTAGATTGGDKGGF